jgi:hypothetical protein
MTLDRFDLPADGLRAAQLCLAQRVPAGDPEQLRAAARRSSAFAAELRHSADVLLSSTESVLWRGVAHRALAEQLHSHAPALSATADRYDGYATALTWYAGALEDTSGPLRTARLRMQEGSAELARRQQTATLPSSTGLLAGLGHDPGAELLALARAFKAGYDRWADALESCIRSLRAVDEQDPTRHRHGLRAWGHELGHVATTVLSPFEQAMLHPSLHAISTCLGELNTALTVLGLGLLFCFPPAAAACLATATVLAVAQLAVDSTRRAHGEAVPATSLGLELAAAIPLGGGAFRTLRAAENVTHLVPGGGLLAHEGIDGAHTLAKHVSKTEDFLRHRLATEAHIRGASTFYDRDTAENAISGLLEANEARINRWLRGDGLRLKLIGRSPRPLGWLVLPGASVATEECGIRVVLYRSTYLGTGYHILTAMVTQ